ncbi:MAG: hypothetical protein AB7U98_00050 [Candidatus Nitrosocosmicus sp.]
MTFVCSLFLLAVALGQPNTSQSVSGQMNTEFQNENVINNSSAVQPAQNTSQQMTSEAIRPDAQIIVLANDLFEIKDNIAEAREALDRGNFFELAQSIQNLDQLVTLIINPLPENTTTTEKSVSPTNDMSTTNSMPSFSNMEPPYNTTKLSDTARGIDANKLK